VRVVGRSWEECDDLDEVVVEDAVPAPGSSPVDAVGAGAVESEVAFRAADPSFATGPPSDHLFERSPVLDLASCGVRSAFAWEHDMAHTQLAQCVFDAGFAVPAIGGRGVRDSTRATSDPFDCGCEHRRVGRVPDLDVVVDDHAVFVVDELGFVTVMPMSA